MTMVGAPGIGAAGGTGAGAVGAAGCSCGIGLVSMGYEFREYGDGVGIGIRTLATLVSGVYFRDFFFHLRDPMVANARPNE